MRVRSVLVAFTCVLPAVVQGNDRQQTLQEQFPSVGHEWVRRGDSGARGPYSWINFENKQSSGEVLSFVLWEVGYPIGVTAAPVAQASIEAFASQGTARLGTSKPVGMPIADTVRHRYVLLRLSSLGITHEIEALEYTYVYRGDGNSKPTMAHGYCTVAGHAVFFVQHTSDKPITSELALGMVGGVLANHYGLARKSYSISRAEVLRAND